MKQKKIKILVLLAVVFALFFPQLSHTQSLIMPLEYTSLIQQKIGSYFIYPQEARLKGWEGVVKIRFILSQDGRIKEIDIAESSGYPLLDAAAILAIKDASPYPFPTNYPQKELEIILPVRFQQEITPPKAISLTKPIEPYKEPYKPTLAPEIPKEQLAEQPEELNAFINLALKNNQPTKVARQEIQLAQIKIAEAQRGLFPGLKLSGYNTTGVATKVDYEEREAKVEVNQPLFYAGKLIDTIKQAKVNMEITKKNYDRVKLDVMHKTETAYYNLVAARLHLQLKEVLLQEAGEMLEKIEKLGQMGMAIPLEVSSSRAWFRQIEFQIESIKQEVSMAELTFKQVLNTKETPQIKAQTLEAEELKLNPDACLQTAFKHRPEIFLSELMVKFNDYGQRIKASEKNGLTVDLTSSYGLYQGHWETEPWTDSSNWFAGIKVTKPWGANTLNTSYSKEETQPRFGQTSATASSTISAEFNLLDNMKRLSEKKKSDIDLYRSLSDFDESLKTVAFEVQDALLNYQKALLQLKTSYMEMEFRRNETEVTKIRALIGETSLSSAIQTIYSFSEAQTKYIQALANYHLSLANFKKATGYGLKI